MRMKLALAGLLALVAAQHAAAVDLWAIRREILKEPRYEGKPRYALLVFGAKDPQTYLWLVRDDKTVYLDRNGNGNLTEPGESFRVFGTSFQVVEIRARDGTRYVNLRVHSGNDGKLEMSLDAWEKRAQYVGHDLMERPVWGNKAENAPIIHFDGPKVLAPYGALVKIPRNDGRGRRFSLRLMVGTPGVGEGTFASYGEVCTQQLGKLQADITYVAGFPFGLPMRQRIELVHDG